MNTVTSATTATRAMAVTHHPVWRVGSGVAVTARKLLVSKVSVAACVVGGVSFAGGVGTVWGVVTGVIIFTVINYGLTYIGINPYWQYIIKGSIIIFAVALDSLKYARKK